MSEQTKVMIKTLVLKGPATAGVHTVAELGLPGLVTTVESPEEAIKELDHHHYDLVVSDPAGFLSVEFGKFDPAAAAILNSLPRGICVVGADSSPIWMNSSYAAYPPDLSARIRDQVARSFEMGKPAGPPATARQFTACSRDHILEVTACPVVCADHKLVQIVVLAADVTNPGPWLQKINAIEAAGRGLVMFEPDQLAHIPADGRLKLLQDRILAYTRELMSFDNFTIRLLDKTTNKLVLVLSVGFSETAQGIDIYASAEGNGITGVVAKQGRSIICGDVSAEPRYLPGIEGAKSSLTVPLRLNGEIIGTFNVESPRAGAFSEEDRQIAEMFGRYVAAALHVLNLLNAEQCAATINLADTVGAQVSGSINDILTEVSAIREDHIGISPLVSRLDALGQKVAGLRDIVRDSLTPHSGMLGRKKRSGNIDPVIGGKTILVADDEEVIRETVCEVLTSYGCRVETASDGAQAVEMIKTHAYDLVLSDIRMPFKTGYDVFAATKDRNTRCPVILMTGFGYDPNHSIVRARREGLSAVLFKPFKVDQLLGEIRSAFQHVPA